jgi:hypothetical protein
MSLSKTLLKDLTSLLSRREVVSEAELNDIGIKGVLSVATIRYISILFIK